MGQQISRRVAGRLEKGLQQARSQMDQEMRNQKHVDPNAAIGFTRGATSDPRDAAQEEFLKREQGPHEMPPDLIKFLNDVGPLERKVDQDFTSPRLRESLLQQSQKQQDADSKNDDKRTIRDMPLMGEEMDHVTARTTNFSTSKLSVEAEQEQVFGLTEVQLYEMMALQKTNDEMWNETMSSKDDDEKDLKFEWMNQSRNYLDIPVILKDKDGDYLGVRKQDVNSSDMFRLTLQPAKGVKFVLSQLLDRANEEKAQANNAKK